MSDNLSKVVCSEHQEEECTFVCTECQVLICDICIELNEHGSHEIQSIKRFIKEEGIEPVECFDEIDFNLMTSKIENEKRKHLKEVIDSIEKRAHLLKTEIEAIKEEMIIECREHYSKNILVINKFISILNPTELVEKIKNLPQSSERSKSACVAKDLLTFLTTMESEETKELEEEQINLLIFTNEKIKRSSLTKMFGRLETAEDENLPDYCLRFIDRPKKCATGDKESDIKTSTNSEDDGLNDFVED